MSASDAIQTQRETDSQLAANIFISKGKLNNKSVVIAKKQTSKGWFIVAILVGTCVILGIGGFGVIGLLQSHGVISMPPSFQRLISAIGTVGHTPHVWSLWAMASGGIIIGGSLVLFGAIKLIYPKVKEGNNRYKFLIKFPSKKISKTTDDSDQPKSALEKSLNKSYASDDIGLHKVKVKQGGVLDYPLQLEKMKEKMPILHFGNNFTKLNLNPNTYDYFPNGTYRLLFLGTYNTENGKKIFVVDPDEDHCFLVIRTHEGTLQCTDRISESASGKLLDFLTKKNYKRTPEVIE